MAVPSLTPPIIPALRIDRPCRLWRPREDAVAPAAQVTSNGPTEDRREAERRGRGVRIFRFTNDRRRQVDRRGRRGRSGTRLPLPVPGEMRHQGINYRVTTADISAKGARLLDAPPLALDALVRLTLEPDDDLAEYPLVVWAQVRSFCGERAMLGVHFVGLRACDARRLTRLVSRWEREAR